MASDLVGYRDHCRRMAADVDQPVKDRALWALLAAEVDAYLSAGDESVETPLFQ